MRFEKETLGETPGLTIYGFGAQDDKGQAQDDKGQLIIAAEPVCGSTVN